MKRKKMYHNLIIALCAGIIFLFGLNCSMAPESSEPANPEETINSTLSDTVIRSGAAAGTNLLLNPSGNQFDNHWRFGETENAGSGFETMKDGNNVFYVKNLSFAVVGMHQYVTLPPQSVGKFVVLLGNGMTQKVYNDLATNHPAISGAQIDGGGFAIYMMRGQDLVHNGDEKYWKPMSGIFRVMPGARKIRFMLHQDYTYEQRNDGTKAYFDDLELVLFDTKAEAEAYCADYIADHPVTYDDLSFPEPDNLVVNGSFFNGLADWDVWKTASEGADASFNVIGEEMVINVKNGGTYPWSIGLVQDNLLVENGLTYELSFTARSDSYRTMQAVVAMADDPWTPYSNTETIYLGQNPIDYNFTFTMNQTTDTNGVFQFNLGNDVGKIYIDNIKLRVKMPSGINLLENSDFNNGLDPWRTYCDSAASASFAVYSGSFHANITNGGTEFWHILLQQFAVVEYQETYTVTFDAKTEQFKNTDIQVSVAQSSAPYLPYCTQQVIEITPIMKTYSYTFTMNDPTDTAAVVEFGIGNQTENICIDNVSIVKH